MTINPRVRFDLPANVSPLRQDTIHVAELSDQEIVISPERLIDEFGAQAVAGPVAELLLAAGIAINTTSAHRALRVRRLEELVQRYIIIR